MASHTSELGETICIPLGSRIGQMALATALGFSGSTGQVGASLLPEQVKGSLWPQYTHFRAGLLTEGSLMLPSRAI